MYLACPCRAEVITVKERGEVDEQVGFRPAAEAPLMHPFLHLSCNNLLSFSTKTSQKCLLIDRDRLMLLLAGYRQDE